MRTFIPTNNIISVFLCVAWLANSSYSFIVTKSPIKSAVRAYNEYPLSASKTIQPKQKKSNISERLVSLFSQMDNDEGGGSNLRWLTSSDKDGSSRGAVLFAFVLFLCVWIFSIPVEFRRAHICPEEYIAAHPTDELCQTGSQWVEGVKEYYANGGGVKFDFSIDPKTVQQNREKLGL